MAALNCDLFGALRHRLVSLSAGISAQARELSRRAREAVRDGHHRLRTGRPRGMPSSFVHPPLECSKGCSQAARRVHGLLYGYSLAYEEVRPRVETMAAALGYSKSTTYNATAELRRADLLVVHERRGKDHRRVANRYEVRCPVARAPLPMSSPPSAHAEVASEVQKTRTPIKNGEWNDKPKPDTGAPSQSQQAKPGLAKVRRRRAVPISEMALAECLGLERFRVLKAKFGEALADLRAVITEHGAQQQGDALVTACDALLAQRGLIKNPAGYLHGILRRQLGDREAVRTELAELMEQYEQARAFGDPNEAELARQLRIRGTEDGIAGKVAAKQSTQGHVGPSHARRARAAEERTSNSPTERRSSPVPLDQLLTNLRHTNPQLAELVARDPFDRAVG